MSPRGVLPIQALAPLGAQKTMQLRNVQGWVVPAGNVSLSAPDEANIAATAKNGLSVLDLELDKPAPMTPGIGTFDLWVGGAVTENLTVSAAAPTPSRNFRQFQVTGRLTDGTGSGVAVTVVNGQPSSLPRMRQGLCGRPGADQAAAAQSARGDSQGGRRRRVRSRPELLPPSRAKLPG